MTTPLYDDSNWREEYKSYTSNKRHLELLENGAKSLSQSWVLGALYNEWKKIKVTINLIQKKTKDNYNHHLKNLTKSMSDFVNRHIGPSTEQQTQIAIRFGSF